MGARQAPRRPVKPLTVARGLPKPEPPPTLRPSAPGLEILYGRQTVREALRAGRRRFLQVLLAEGIEPGGIVAEIVAYARERACPVRTVPRSQLDALGNVHHQGVVAEVSPFPYADVDDLLKEAQERGEPPLLLLVDHLQDPQNLGSLLRTAEAVGAHGAILPQRRAVGVTPAVSHASAGAAEHLAVAPVTNLAQTMAYLKQRGVWLVGLHPGPQAVPYDRADLKGPLGLIVGAEGAGLSRLVRERCDFLISLPLRGHISSLNAAVAGAIALYEARRQRDT
jgi:23S rRNA (guanosine2251-2'-O)-methyltransferase